MDVKSSDIAKGAIKYDQSKLPIYDGFIAYFPRAIEAVTAVSAFGASKYAWNGWRSVDNGFNRYTNASLRHLLDQAKGKVVDDDSGFANLAHEAWNALARLELFLTEQEKAPEAVVGNDSQEART